MLVDRKRPSGYPTPWQRLVEAHFFQQGLSLSLRLEEVGQLVKLTLAIRERAALDDANESVDALTASWPETS